MAYWDETVQTVDQTTKKKTFQVIIDGDIDDNFLLTASIVKVISVGGLVISSEKIDEVSVTYDAAFADVVLEPFITKIKNGIRGLVRELRKA